MDPIEKSLRLAWLIKKQLEQTLTGEEAAEMDDLLRELPQQDRWMNDLTNARAMSAGLKAIESVQVDRGWERLQSAIQAHEQPSLWRKMIGSWKLAAMLTGSILISGVIIWQLIGRETSYTSQKAITQTARIDPGKDRAYLVLEDGSEILLDSAENGKITEQGNTRVLKQGDFISYQHSDPRSTPVFNTVRTPRGGQFRLELADGSRVWLNAASSLRFPTSFSDGPRTVELTGEAYFEVKSDPKRPFTVEVGTLKVDATGTRFNINAYPDEIGILTSLAEGSVRVRSINATVTLKPEQEVMTTPNGNLNPVKSADLETTLAWTNGKFVFSGADVPTIMRQIGRWYDVEVIYLGPIRRETFTGMVSRQSDISRVLRIMEAGGIRFRIEKNKIMVE